MLRRVLFPPLALIISILTLSTSAYAAPASDAVDVELAPIVWAQNVHSAHCMSALNQTDPVVFQADCDFSSSATGQQWNTFTVTGGAGIFFQNMHSGKCLSVRDDVADPEVFQTNCVIDPLATGQQWSQLSEDQLRNLHSGRCLAVQDPTESHLPIIQTNCVDDNSQKWVLLV